MLCPPSFCVGELLITYTCTCTSNDRNHKRLLESHSQLKLQANPKNLERDRQKSLQKGKKAVALPSKKKTENQAKLGDIFSINRCSPTYRSLSLLPAQLPWTMLLYWCGECRPCCSCHSSDASAKALAAAATALTRQQKPLMLSGRGTKVAYYSCSNLKC